MTAVNERQIRIGGLYRCCIATIRETTTPSEIGTVLDCAYETPGNGNLIVAHDGVWQWHSPSDKATA